MSPVAFQWHVLKEKQPKPKRQRLLVIIDGDVREAIYEPNGVYGKPTWKDPCSDHHFITPTHWGYLPAIPTDLKVHLKAIREGMKQPIQPIIMDEFGTFRFQANAIVRYLLDNGGIDMNDLARLEFSNEDRQQFAQLIGYSLGSYGKLTHYVDDAAYETAERMLDTGEDERDARIAVLEAQLKAIREGLRGPVAKLYGRHPDDLMEVEK